MFAEDQTRGGAYVCVLSIDEYIYRIRHTSVCNNDGMTSPKLYHTIQYHHENTTVTHIHTCTISLNARVNLARPLID